MAGPKQIVHIPLLRGMDQKSEGRALEPPSLTVCENAVFDKVGGIQKRPGTELLSRVTQNGTTLSRLRALAAYRDELLLFAEGSCLSRSEKDNAWMDRGWFESVYVEQKTAVAITQTDSAGPGDRATLSGVTVVAWGNTYRVFDAVTGAVYDAASAPLTLDSNGLDPKVRAVGDRIHIYFVNQATTPRELRVRVIDPADVYGTIESTSLALATDVNAGQDYDVDVDTTTGVAFIAYRTSASPSLYTVLLVSSAGAVTTTKAKARSCDGQIAISILPGGTPHLVVARHADAATTDAVRVDMLDGAGADASNVDILVEEFEPQRITCLALASFGALILYDGSFGATLPFRVRHATVDSTPTVTVRNFVRHSKLASRLVRWSDAATVSPFSSTERALVHVVYSSDPLQTQYVLMDAQQSIGPVPSGQEEEHDSGGFVTASRFGGLARLAPGSAVNLSNPHALPQIESTGTNTFAWVGLVARRLITEERYQFQASAEHGLVEWSYTFADPRAYRAVEAGESLYIPGGYLAQYDGERVVENGFWVFPPEVEPSTKATLDDTGGFLVDGATYAYRFYWEWTNDRGERERSSGITVSKLVTGMTGSDNRVIWTIPALPYTHKDSGLAGLNVVLAVYRTTANPGVGAPFYRCSSTNPSHTDSYVTNDPNRDEIVWVDETFGDAQLVEQELDYQNTGELDNVPVSGPPQFIDSAQNRLFAVVAGRPDSLSCTKLRFEGDLVTWNEALEIALPERGGDVTGVAAGEDAVVALKDRAVYAVPGTGPDNLGAGGYGAAQLVAEGIGCSVPASIVRIPDGAMFLGAKGFYLLDRAYQLQFVGAAVDDFKTRSITGAVARPVEHQVLFTCTSGGTLMYDYLVREWSDWPAQSNARSPVLSRDKYHLLRQVQGHILREAPSIYYDAASLSTALGDEYHIRVVTAWIKLAGLEGFGRARWWSLLGESRQTDACIVDVGVSYGLDDTVVDQHAIEVADIDVGDPVRLRKRFSTQRTSAVKFTLGTSAAGEARAVTPVTLLASGHDSSNVDTDYVIADPSPTTGYYQDLVVMTVSDDADAQVISVTGAGLTWVEVDSPLTIQTGNVDEEMVLSRWRALGTPTPGDVTVAYGSVERLSVSYIWAEYGGVDTGGSSGSTAVVQQAIDFNESGATPEISQATFEDPMNIHAVVALDAADSLGLDAAFTVLGHVTGTGPTTGLWLLYAVGVEDCVSPTSPSDSNALWGLEIKSAETQAPVTRGCDLSALSLEIRSKGGLYRKRPAAID